MLNYTQVKNIFWVTVERKVRDERITRHALQKGSGVASPLILSNTLNDPITFEREARRISDYLRIDFDKLKDRILTELAAHETATPEAKQELSKVVKRAIRKAGLNYERIKLGLRLRHTGEVATIVANPIANGAHLLRIATLAGKPLWKFLSLGDQNKGSKMTLELRVLLEEIRTTPFSGQRLTKLDFTEARHVAKTLMPPCRTTKATEWHRKNMLRRSQYPLWEKVHEVRSCQGISMNNLAGIMSTEHGTLRNWLKNPEKFPKQIERITQFLGIRMEEPKMGLNVDDTTREAQCKAFANKMRPLVDKVGFTPVRTLCGWGDARLHSTLKNPYRNLWDARYLCALFGENLYNYIGDDVMDPASIDDYIEESMKEPEQGNPFRAWVVFQRQKKGWSEQDLVDGLAEVLQKEGYNPKISRNRIARLLMNPEEDVLLSHYVVGLFSDISADTLVDILKLDFKIPEKKPKGFRLRMFKRTEPCDEHKRHVLGFVRPQKVVPVQEPDEDIFEILADDGDDMPELNGGGSDYTWDEIKDVEVTPEIAKRLFRVAEAFENAFKNYLFLSQQKTVANFLQKSRWGKKWDKTILNACFTEFWRGDLWDAAVELAKAATFDLKPNIIGQLVDLGVLEHKGLEPEPLSDEGVVPDLSAFVEDGDDGAEPTEKPLSTHILALLEKADEIAVTTAMKKAWRDAILLRHTPEENRTLAQEWGLPTGEPFDGDCCTIEEFISMGKKWGWGVDTFALLHQHDLVEAGILKENGEFEILEQFDLARVPDLHLEKSRVEQILLTLDEDKAGKSESYIPFIKEALGGTSNKIYDLLDSFMKKYGMDVSMTSYGDVPGAFFGEIGDVSMYGGTLECALEAVMYYYIEEMQKN
jgi:hypothetical protein